MTTESRPDKWPLHILVVEDDMTSCMMMVYQLEQQFLKVTSACNGREGLALFLQSQPDIVLTDNVMPEMDGIDMISEIRQTNPAVPVILVTSSLDSDLLIKAINLNVTRFLPKPVSAAMLGKVIGSEVRQLQTRQIMQKRSEMEIELLKYRERYHSQQQDMAFSKQLNIIRNDHPCHPFACRRKRNRVENWLCESAFLPLDTLSGDSYSIRKLDDGSMFLFIVDAMGKGLSASITSVLSTSCLNDIVDRTRADAFSLRTCLDEYLPFIRKQLLEDEILSAVFIHISADEPYMEFASFSMPPVLLLDHAGKVRRLNSNNLPVSRYLEKYTVARHSLGSMRSLAVYSDGLNEAEMDNGGLYRQQIDLDFAASLGGRQFWRRFRSAVSRPEDDVTLIVVGSVEYSFSDEIRLVIPGRLSEVEQACSQLEGYLADSGPVSPLIVEESSIIIREILMNAYEHGSLGIGTDLKQKLLLEDTYFEYLAEREKDFDLDITVVLRFGADMGRKMFCLDVTDQGPGFNANGCVMPRPDTLHPNGRGLHIIATYADRLYFCSKGNHITIVKYIEEDAHGTCKEQLQ